MMTLTNAAAIRAAVDAGELCDVGHYYCPTVRADGAVIFPSGIVRPDGRFHGAARLAEALARIPADARYEPVAPRDRYPTCGRRADPAHGRDWICGTCSQPRACERVA